MTLDGVHLLLTYSCPYDCDHCFVWGSPEQMDAMTAVGVRKILRQADALGTVEWIYFEGGEPFLCYRTLCAGVDMASLLGFKVGVVTNGYWATDEDTALELLRPFAGKVKDLSLSCDAYHGDTDSAARVDCARAAALSLDIPCEVIAIAPAGKVGACRVAGKIPPGESLVRFRGRAAHALAPQAPKRPWREFDICPCEDLIEPGRVHVDPLGHVHVCQGIAVGNAFDTSLSEICRDYNPDAHPIIGPLLRGGPARLVENYRLPHDDEYADACHLCDAARRQLRSRFPDTLTPESMYGVPHV